MREYTFLIPFVRDSDRVPHLDIEWRWLQDRLIDEFGGLTYNPAVTGMWKNEHRQFIEDYSRSVSVACSDEDSHLLMDILKECLTRFDQQSIYCSAGPPDSVFFVKEK